MSGKNQLPAKGENGYEVYRREAASFNKPDAVNPAMTLWLTIEDQWRRVADLGRSVSDR